MSKSAAPVAVTQNLTICDISKFQAEVGDEDSTYYPSSFISSEEDNCNLQPFCKFDFKKVPSIQILEQCNMTLITHLLSYSLHQAKSLKFHLSRLMRLIDLV